MSAPVPSGREGDPLARHRAAARRLHQDLRARDPARARAAATRLVRLRSLEGLAVDALVADPSRVRRKHALAVIAQEAGAGSWLELGRRVAVTAAATAEVPEYYAPALGVYLNRWFADHAEAKASLHRDGGYLLPFRAQCFVAEAPAIELLGLSAADPDWQAVGFDLVAPADAAACARIHARRRAAIAAGIGVPEARRARR